MRVAPLLLTATLALATGCQSAALVDDVDIDLDFVKLVGPFDSLHSPYVVGSSMGLYVNSRYLDRRGLTISSSDPNTFRVGASHDETNGDFSYAQADALAEGDVTLSVLDRDSHVVSTRTVEVRFPDRVDLLAHGPLLTRRPDLDASFGDGRILSGGTATYLARYYKNGEQLSGNGALTASTVSGAATTNIAHSFLFEDRDWLQITTGSTGPFTVELDVGGQKFGTVSGAVVPESAVANVAIYGEDESKAVKDELLVALGYATDAGGNPIYGVEFSWELDGQAQLGMGDLYLYKYDPKKKGTLAALFGNMSTTAAIHGVGGYVSSSNFVGCSAVPGGASPLRGVAGLLLLGAVVAWALAKRRRSAILGG